VLLAKPPCLATSEAPGDVLPFVGWASTYQRRFHQPTAPSFATAYCTGTAMTKTSKAERRWAHEQALASTRISGHQPSAEFLADCEAVIEGTMTHEQARAASLARALAKDQAVSHDAEFFDDK
jgi:hypothetical protein